MATAHLNNPTATGKHLDGALTVRQAFERHYPKDGLSALTVLAYRKAISVWERHTHNPPVESIGKRTAAEFRQALIDAAYRPRTIRNVTRTIRTVLRRLEKPTGENPDGLGIIERAPRFETIQVKADKRGFTLDDLTRVYQSCSVATHPKDVDPQSWWQCAVLMAYTTGLRNGEVFSIEVDNVDLDSETVVITDRKWGLVELPLHPLAVDHIRRIMPPSGLLFGEHYQTDAQKGLWRHQWKKITTHAAVGNMTFKHVRRLGQKEIRRVRQWVEKSWTREQPPSAGDDVRDAIRRMVLPVSTPKPEPAKTGNMTLADFLEDVFIHRKRSRLSEGYIVQMRVAVNLFERFARRTIRLSDLSDDLIEEFMAWIHDQGRAARTVNGKGKMILTLWRYAYRKRFIDEQPRDAEMQRCPKTIRSTWTMEEFKRILDQCAQVKTRRGWSGRHWIALLLTLYDTGCRIGALLQVPKEALGLDAGTLLIAAEYQKNDTDQLFHLHPETLHAIRDMEPLKGAELFAWPWDKKDIQRHYKRRILVPAGLPHGRRDLFHKIRRTSFSAVYIQLGAKAAQLHAGHSTDLSRLYLDPDRLVIPPAITVLPRPSGQQPVKLEGGAA